MEHANSPDAINVVTKLAQERAPDIIEALNAQKPAAAAGIFQYLPPEKAIEVLDQPGLDNECEIIATLPSDKAVELLSGVSADRAADIFGEVMAVATLTNGGRR